MDSIDIVTLVIEQYGTAGAIAALLALKGCASVIANNFHTEEWGKVGQVIEWLASNNKKAKLTGDVSTDSLVEKAIKNSKPVKKLTKILNVFS